MLAYGDEVGNGRDTKMDAHTFRWYNKFFYDISQTGKSKGFGDPCPMHTEYVDYGQDKDIFTI